MSIFAIRKIISHMSIVKYGEKTAVIQCATIKRLKRNIDGRMKIGGTKIFTSRVWGRHAPARALQKRFDDELIEFLLRFKWWDRSIDEINRLIPILTCSDLDKVKAEIKKQLG